MWKFPAVLLVVGAWAAPAAAQPLEAGGFIGVDAFGDTELGNSWAADQRPGTAPSVGGRITWWALPGVWRGDALALSLGVEGEASLALSTTDAMASAGRASYRAPVIGLGAHAILRLATGTAVTPHLLVGGGADLLFTSSPYASDDADPLGYWGGGASWAITGRMALRLDLRHGLAAGRAHPLTSTFAFTAGLTAAWGEGSRRAPRPAPPPVEDPDPDRDGVLGDADLCPAVAESPDGLDDGDGCPETDDDGDGFAGSRDACPDQPEDRDGFRDDDGCPEPDNDGDGKDDHVDACPDHAETVNGLEDDDGCPDVLPAAIAKLEGALAVSFGGKARLTGADKRALDRVATALRATPGVRVRLDGVPGKGADVALTKRRVEVIKWYLVDRGVAADRIDDALLAPGGAARIELHVAIPKS
ncbi:MAG: hypothetical protein K8W52_06615 [Deltaproteobacteria bacterium]|nr:hypothetical protein [Deltaproteobacteria bacterium]